MSFDFHAHWGEALSAAASGVPDKDAHDRHDGTAVRAFIAQYGNSDPDILSELLELTLPGERSPKKKLAGAVGKAWREATASQAQRECVSRLRPLLEPVVRLETLPRFSWYLDLEFQLAKDLITKDENALYPTENPFRRDRAFGIPCFAASSWKGNLRSTFLRVHGTEKDPGRLFGTESADSGEKGRVWCFSSNFEKVSFAVLNPHDRAKKIGMPIFVETVPAKSSSHLRLLYCPFQGAGRATADAASVVREAAEDLASLVDPIWTMLTVIGFGAKTSSGFGTASPESIKGKLQIHAPLVSAAQAVAGPVQSLAGYLKSPTELKDEYMTDGKFRVWNDHEYQTRKKSDRQEYDKAKKWWDKRQGELAKPVPPPPLPPAAPPVTAFLFDSTHPFITVVEKGVQQLRNLAEKSQ